MTSLSINSYPWLILNISILILTIISAIAIIRSKNLLTATICLSIFSLLMACQYLVLGAPDVAITEAAVGAGISTILLVLSLSIIGEKEKKTYTKTTLYSLIVIVILAVILVYSTFSMPKFGDPTSPANSHVASYYVKNSHKETGIPNMVTSILASYRGYDTLGETTVIFTAAIAVILLLGFKKVE